MNYEREIWRLTSRVSGGVALLAMAVFSWLSGFRGFWGALIASSVAVIFFAIHLAVSVLTRNMEPLATMSLVMFSYFAKVLGLAGFLIAFRRADFIDQRAFAITAILVTAAWLAAELRAFVKLRLLLIQQER